MAPRQGAKTAQACPPKLADYPPGSWPTTIGMVVLIVWSWISTCVVQCLFLATVGWMLPKHRRENYTGYIFRWFSRFVFLLHPSLGTPRLSPGSWRPTREMVQGKQGVLVVCNHRSFLDAFALCSALLPLETKYIAKGDLFSVPFGGWAMRMAGDLPVLFTKDKDGWGTQKGSTGKLLESAGANLTAGNSVAIFPEGVRMGVDPARAAAAGAHASRMGEFKPPFFDLAKKLGVPVVVAAMKGADDVWPVGSNMMRPAGVTLSLSEPIWGKDFATDADFAAAARDKMGKMYAELCK